jgi:glycerol uptake facilitator-like aquaporin
VLPSATQRSGSGQWLSELIATFGLVLVVRGVARQGLHPVAAAVAAYITAAYWFTASTSFANPAVTLARSLTNTFSGIRFADTLGFVLAQCAGAGLGYQLSRWLQPATLRD